MFFYGPELLFRGEWLDIAGVFVSASFGVYLLASSTEGWYAGGRIGWPARSVLFVSALLLIDPGLLTYLIGLGGAILVYAYQRLVVHRAVA